MLIECGFGWLPALGWRLDKHWKRLKDEVPHLKTAPSEYIRKHFWVTTQPMEEPENPEHLHRRDELDRLGPHHVLDRLPALGLRRSVRLALPPTLTDEQRRKIYAGNARALYRLD